MSTASMPLLSDLSNALARLVAEARRSIVAVHSPRLRASGFAFRPGLIVTADETLADEGPFTVVLPDGQRVGASVKGRDAATDIALLEVAGTTLPDVPLTSDTQPTAGALAIVVGAEDANTVSALGSVAAVGSAWRSIRGGEIGPRVELDVRLRAACEGGLAIDASGNALGMVVSGPRHRVLVIPAATIERVAGRLEQSGRIARGYLGVGLQPVRVDGDDDATGAIVLTVDARGPAAASGVRQGDVIVGFNGEAVGRLRGLARSLGPDSVGSVVRLSARRGGERIEFDVRIAARPDA